ncbi:uncharacterized protein LOC130717545 isoform X2 [Lotus japonicus]|nr:uncharacterized protein LOC130717545 isoform X2 [Lotus japonicus]
MQEINHEKGSSSRQSLMRLLDSLWAQVRQLEYEHRLSLITEPSVVLFDAIKSGNIDVAKWLLYMNRELLTIKNPKTGQNLLHFVVLYRQRSIFYFILKMDAAKFVVRAVDKDYSNVLHLAASATQQKVAASSLRPYIQMSRELQWFKEVEKVVPPELRTMRNKDGKTPHDMFHTNHKNLSMEVKDSAKGVANSGMVVATLIVAVAFSAALTNPGDDKSNAWFIVFNITNAAALFTSASSIISFLSFFTSPRFKESDFIISLHPSLIIGKILLFISVATMVMAFIAASFLIFDQVHKWVAYIVASFGLLPVTMFLVLHFSIFDGLLGCCFSSRYYHDAS